MRQIKTPKRPMAMYYLIALAVILLLNFFLQQPIYFRVESRKALCKGLILHSFIPPHIPVIQLTK